MRPKHRELSTEEYAALVRFAAAHGRTWKRQLTDVYWYNARPWREHANDISGYILHGLRNDPRFGHDGVRAFRFKPTAK